MIDAQAISGMRNPRVRVVVDERDWQAELLRALGEQRAIG
jgi:hypothetical protein